MRQKCFFSAFYRTKDNDRSAALQEALFNGYTTVLYESPKRLDKLLHEIVISAPERRVFLAKEITKKYQRFYQGTASELLCEMEGEIRGEWVVVIEASASCGASLNEAGYSSLGYTQKSGIKAYRQNYGRKSKRVLYAPLKLIRNYKYAYLRKTTSILCT